MIQEIKKLRVNIDGLSQLTKELKPYKKLNGTDGPWGRTALWKICNSEEIEKARDSLLLAKTWLGIILKELGNKSPYPKDGTRKTIEDIEPTSDIEEVTKKYIDEGKTDLIVVKLKGDKHCKRWLNLSYIEKVDYLRQRIQNVIDTTTDFSQEKADIELEQSFVYKYLCEAKFWLGFELSRYRDENKK